MSGMMDPSTVSVVMLHAACRAGRSDAIQSLVSNYGLDVNGRDVGGWTVLHTAIVHGEENVVRQLRPLGAEDAATDDGVYASDLRPALWARVAGQDLMATNDWEPSGTVAGAVNQLVEMMMEGDVSTNVLCRRVCVSVMKLGTMVLKKPSTVTTGRVSQLENRSLLPAAAWSGHASLCRLCVEYGVDVDRATTSARLQDGQTPLLLACERGHLACARILVAHGAAIDRGNVNGVRPLAIACRHGRIDCARLLVHRGAAVNKEAMVNGATPLLFACEGGHSECARLLLDHGAKSDRANWLGATPLWAACCRGHLDCVRLLLALGVAAADKPTRNNGSTPLSVSCSGGHSDCVRALLEHATNLDMGEALHVACRRGHHDCAHLLLHHGAKVDEADCRGWTPLLVACKFGHLECARLLLDRGADVETTARDGQTPLHVACSVNCRHIVLLLLERGADATKRDRGGETPVTYARLHSCADPEMADVVELAVHDRQAAIERLRGMDAEGPRPL